MTALLAPPCDHPEDRRGPLPYDGKPPRGDEWECLECGVWHVSEIDQPSLSDQDRADLDDDLSANISASVGGFTAALARMGTTLSTASIGASRFGDVARQAIADEELAATMRTRVILPQQDPPASYDLRGLTFDHVTVGDALRALGARINAEPDGHARITLELPDDQREWVDVAETALGVGRAVRPPFASAEVGLVTRMAADEGETTTRLRGLAALASRVGHSDTTRLLASRRTIFGLRGQLLQASFEYPTHVFGLPLERVDPPHHVPDRAVVLAVRA